MDDWEVRESPPHAAFLYACAVADGDTGTAWAIWTEATPRAQYDLARSLAAFMAEIWGVTPGLREQMTAWLTGRSN